MAQRKKGPERVQQALESLGFEVRVQELPASTRTAEEAAQAVGCSVGQIAKSLVFKGRSTGRAYLVIASGSNRVDERKLAGQIGEEIGLAAPDFVREQTGYAIGGVPPLGHERTLPAYLDKDLLDYDEIWAAAGSPRAVFAISPEKIRAAAEAQVLELAMEGAE